MAISFGAEVRLATERLALVSDDDETGNIWTSILEHQNFDVVRLDVDSTTLGLIRTLRCALVVLAVQSMQPAYVKFIRALRSKTDAPVVMLFPRYDEEVLLKAFEAGADDYIFGSVSPRFMTIKVRAWLRRVRAASLRTAHDSSPRIRLDTNRRMVMTPSGKAVKLTHMEFRLMSELMRQPGYIHDSQGLTERIWGFATGDNSQIKNLVYRLRLKLEQNGFTFVNVESVPGTGYMLTIADTPESA